MKRARRIAAVCGAALAGALLLAGCCTERRWRGPVTDHFDGRTFFNPEPTDIGMSQYVRRTLSSRRGPWRDFTNTPPAPRPPERVSEGRLRVTFVNHDTFLIQMDGVNILTDPTWAKRSVPLVGPRRRRPPGLRFEDLPPIDAVLVSHNHFDHMDVPTLRRLASEQHPAVFTGPGNARYLERKGVSRARDLDWWQSAEIAPGITITAVPARHLSGRGLFDQDRTLWCGFVVEGPSGAFYFAGDTGRGAHFAEIGRRFPRLRLALLPIGGFKPVWFMRDQHLGPVDAVAAERALGAGTTVPMHFGTFPVSDDAETEPVELLRAALKSDPDAARRFVILDNGESAEIPPVGEPRVVP